MRISLSGKSRFILVAVFLVYWSTGFYLSAGQDEAKPPTNVVLVTIDTLRADHLRSYGYEAIKTPVISALADEGVLFENVIAQTPITLPSHASILTGTYPFYHGLQDVVGRLRDGVPTLAEWFKEQGYATGAVVGSSVLLAQWGLDRGFDFYEDNFPTQGIRQVDFSRVERPANRVIDLALSWLENNRDRPFFLWVHLYDPHDPYEPPEPFASQYREQPYDGEVEFIDSELGRFFEGLKKWGLYDDSLIVFTSDHGESLGEHKEKYHAYYIYDCSIRIPLIFRIPAHLSKGQLSPGSRIPNQVRSVDIAPTVMQLLGKQVMEWIQGEGLVAMMAGKRPNIDLDAYAETHYPRIHFGWSPLFSYSTPEHKFIEAPITELYDLKQDPGEVQSIIEKESALANQLKSRMYELQKKYAPVNRGEDGSEAVDVDTIERLKALGYVAFAELKIDTYNRLNEAIELSRKGEREPAVAILREVAVIEPEMPIVHFMLGSEYFQLGLFLKAVEEFLQTLKYNPESNVARFSLARSYMGSGLLDRAEEVVRELITLEPANYGARHLLATILAKRGDFQGAVEEERFVVEHRPSYVEALNNLGSYYLNLGKNALASEAYLQALQTAPNNVMIRANLTLAFLNLRQFEKALEQAQAVTRLAPGLGLGHYYLGQAYRGQGMNSEARAAFNKARELDPKFNVPNL
jgi:arylsulfatase A-like enzyme/cytochrome c-type biogenesis protein CcmH/NrfG